MKDKCYLIEPELKVDVVYIHVPNDANHSIWAYNMVNAWNQFDPGYYHQFVLVGNGGVPGQQIIDMFKLVCEPKLFIHDDSGWDIGAYQHYCQESKADMVVFLGGSTYLRRAGWLARMVEVFKENKGVGLFGACGNTGDSRFNVYPHVRTTGFWCNPQLMNSYPIRIVKQEQRYEFEHGPLGISSWCRKNGVPVLVADFTGVYAFPHWNDGPNGYARGNQSDLLVGDRLTAPPFFPNP